VADRERSTVTMPPSGRRPVTTTPRLRGSTGCAGAGGR
jgi:hypothetical protein